MSAVLAGGAGSGGAIDRSIDMSARRVELDDGAWCSRCVLNVGGASLADGPDPNALRAGNEPDRRRSNTKCFLERLRARIDEPDRLIVSVKDPHLAASHGDPCRAVPDRNAGDDAIRLRIDHRNRVRLDVDRLCLRRFVPATARAQHRCDPSRFLGRSRRHIASGDNEHRGSHLQGRAQPPPRQPMIVAFCVQPRRLNRPPRPREDRLEPVRRRLEEALRRREVL